jgi:hypothetical protein
MGFKSSRTGAAICLAAVVPAAISCQPVHAQQQRQLQTKATTLSSLTAQGFEVKAVFLGGEFFYFTVQKGKDVFLCALAIVANATIAPGFPTSERSPGLRSKYESTCAPVE